MYLRFKEKKINKKKPLQVVVNNGNIILCIDRWFGVHRYIRVSLLCSIAWGGGRDSAMFFILKKLELSPAPTLLT